MNPAPYSEVLALSFDGQASPAATLRGEDEGQRTLLPSKWGIGWYPDNQRGAAILRDTDLPEGSALAGHLERLQDVRSSLFLAHTHAFVPRADPDDVQPFTRSYAGRSWLLACSGALRAELKSELALEDAFDIAPVGASAIEHAFSWVLAQLRSKGSKTIEDYGWKPLQALLRKLNQYGPASFLMSDGIDLVAYRDAEDLVPMHWARLTPPHEVTRLVGRTLEIDLDCPIDASRTLFALSAHPMVGARWTPLEPGELRVVRRGQSVWSSHPVNFDEHVFGLVDAPAATAGIANEAHACREQQSAAAPAVLAPITEHRPDEAVLSVLHRTRYVYETPVERSSHRFCLVPVRDERQEVLEHSLEISVNGLRRDFEDVFGNRTTLLEVSKPFEEMTVTSRSRVQVRGVVPAELKSPVRRDQIPLVWMPWQRQMMQAYLMPPELPEPELRELSEFAMSFVERCDYDLVETLFDLNRTIYRDFTYVPGSTTVETTPFQVYAQRRGVCQDFANVFICVARLLGVPARYRVGYIHTGASYENQIQSDASHAWAEVYLPWMGWFGFDPTNGCLAGSDHVRIACGRQFRDATPTSGTIYRGGGFETLSIEVRVERASDDPAVAAD